MLSSILKNDDKKQNPQTLVEAFNFISNRIRGWGNQYKFCNDISLMNSIDVEITKLIVPYFFGFAKALSSNNEDIQRRLIGVWSLNNCKKDPISF